MHTLKLSLVQQTYDTNINMLLGSISCYQTRLDKTIDIISSHQIDDQQGLFEVEFVQVSINCELKVKTRRAKTLALNNVVLTLNKFINFDYVTFYNNWKSSNPNLII